MSNNTNAFTSTVLPPGESGDTDLVVFSHLRWDFVYQRPQHLLSRCAKERRVFFIEEPIYGNCSMRLEVREADPGVHVVVPHLPEGLRSEIAINAVIKEMTRQFFTEQGINEYIFWYYTPMALEFSRELPNAGIVFD